jgi:hypothetical protein
LSAFTSVLLRTQTIVSCRSNLKDFEKTKQPGERGRGEGGRNKGSGFK